MSRDEVMTEYARYVRNGGPEGYFTWHEFLAYEAREEEYYNMDMYPEDFT